jgi:hypothetical protein
LPNGVFAGSTRMQKLRSSSSRFCLISRIVCVVEKNSSLKQMLPTRIASRSSAQRQGNVSFHAAGHNLRKLSNVLLSGRASGARKHMDSFRSLVCHAHTTVSTGTVS